MKATGPLENRHTGTAREGRPLMRLRLMQALEDRGAAVIAVCMIAD